MSTFASMIFFLVSPALVSSSGCDQSSAIAKMTPCLSSIQTASGSTCDKWNTAVCCLKHEFSTCGVDFSSTIDTVVSSMKTTLGAMNIPGVAVADISSCPDPACSGGSTSIGGSTSTGDSTATSAPVAVTHAIDALIEFASTVAPTTFNLEAYTNAVKEKTGVAPEATVKNWEVVIGYAVPDGTTDAQLKTAVAAAMSVAESLVNIMTGSGGRRLTGLRRLAVDKEVTIVATDAAKAKELKVTTQGTAALDSLKTTLGGDVTVNSPPKTKVKVETKLTSTKTKAELEAELKDSSVASAVGGTITVVQNSESLETNENGGVQSGMTVATCMALAMAAGIV